MCGLILLGCNNSPKNADSGFFFQDFDNLKMWTHEQTVTGEKAHSGSFSTFTDSMHEYSQTFEMELDYAKSKGYKSVTITAWCYMENKDAKVSVVGSIESAAGSSAYESADLRSFLTKPNTWGQVTKFLKLPDVPTPGSRIKVYMWAPEKNKAFMDDVTIKFE